MVPSSQFHYCVVYRNDDGIQVPTKPSKQPAETLLLIDNIIIFSAQLLQQNQNFLKQCLLDFYLTVL